MVFVFVLSGDTDSRHENNLEPSFLMPIDNITVPVGRDATLNCVVQNLGNYKVFIETLLIIRRIILSSNVRWAGCVCPIKQC
jgi:hypothetical protein